MNLKKLLIALAAIIVCATMTACGLEMLRLIIPEKGEIVLDQIPLSENIEGKRVYFTGLQIYSAAYGYNNTSIFRYHEESPIFDKNHNLLLYWPTNGVWYITIKLIENIDEVKRSRLTVLFDERGYCTRLLYMPFIRWDDSKYGASFGIRQQYVIDELSCFNVLPFRTPYRNGVRGKMAADSSKSIRRISDADYFLVFAIRPLEIWLPEKGDQNIIYKIALITALYNRAGKKVYSEVYTESFVKNQYEWNMYYHCIIQLLDNYRKQVNKDLSFLNTAAKAEYPTLDDLHVKAYNTESKDIHDLYLPRKH